MCFNEFVEVGRLGKATSLEKIDAESLYVLEKVSAKLRAIAHLVETQRPHDPPVDIENVYYGLGILLTELGSEIKRVFSTGEELQIRTAKRRIPSKKRK